jgi:hypothetical protein
VTFSSDGTMSWSGGASGTWTHSGSLVKLTWHKSEVDIDTMNNSHWRVEGVKQ